MKPLLILCALALSMGLTQAAMPRLQVSENKRFLVTDNGRDVLARYTAMQQAALAAVQSDIDYLASLLARNPSV